MDFAFIRTNDQFYLIVFIPEKTGRTVTIVRKVWVGNIDIPKIGRNKRESRLCGITGIFVITDGAILLTHNKVGQSVFVKVKQLGCTGICHSDVLVIEYRWFIDRGMPGPGAIFKVDERSVRSS